METFTGNGSTSHKNLTRNESEKKIHFTELFIYLSRKLEINSDTVLECCIYWFFDSWFKTADIICNNAVKMVKLERSGNGSICAVLPNIISPIELLMLLFNYSTLRFVFISQICHPEIICSTLVLKIS